MKRVPVVLLLAALSVGVAARAAPAPAVIVPSFERHVLGNGVTVLLMPQREVPLIGFTAVLRGGARADPPGKAGLATLTAQLLEKGAGKRGAFEFADAVAGVGGSFAANAGTEAITVGGQFLARDRALLLELLADALLRPKLDPAEFESLRARQIEFIKAAKDSDPSALIGAYGRALLFGGHPYGRPAFGSERSLAGIASADVVEFYRAQFGGDRLTLIFTGDIDSKWLLAAVRRAFGSWPRARAMLPALTEVPRVAGRRVLLVDAPGSSQTYFWIGNVGVARRFADRAALDIANTLYGGRFTSILNTELRIKSGLTYSVSSWFTRGSVAGEFAISSFTQTQSTERAIDLTLETLASFGRGSVGAETLESARAYVLGQYPLRLETAANWAGALAELELYGLDRSYIESYGPKLSAVTTGDLDRVIAANFPRVENLDLVLIGDAAKVREVARKYGPVTEVALISDDFVPPQTK